MCLQTLKLFNDAKLCEDEKSFENVDNSKSNINIAESAKIEKNYVTNSADKKSKKELVPIPARKNLKENLSPKNYNTNNNSFQTNGKFNKIKIFNLIIYK